MYERDDTITFIDALPSVGEEARFWRWADQRCEGRQVAALTTIGFHRRGRDALVERYRARTSRAKRSLPRGVESFPLAGAGETIFWLGEHRALVPGDRILGADAGELRMCPESWLRYTPGAITLDDLRELLTPLLQLPIASVLVSHGEPVLENGHRSLARALA